MAKGKNPLHSYEPAAFRRTFGVVVWFICFVFFMFVTRLWYLQIIRGDELRKRSEENRIRIQDIKPLRGLIYDSERRVLAGNQPSFDVSIIPQDARDVKAVVAKLDSLYARCGFTLDRTVQEPGKGLPFAPVKLDRHIDRDRLALVETNTLDLPGVVVETVAIRQYTYGAMMAHVLGYVGDISRDELEGGSFADYKCDDRVGKNGIEKAMERYLRGKRGSEQVEVNVMGRKLNVLGVVEPYPGNNVVTTLDAEIQKMCWNAFEEKAGAAIVMDPRDGSVLAMVSKPSYDPAFFDGGISSGEWKTLTTDPLSPLQNKAIAAQYPPGSTYKVVVALAALEEGIVTPGKTIFCDGEYTLGNRTFRCWKKHGHGTVDLERAIIESCDIYFYRLGELVGVDTLAEYARAFGLGGKTGIALAGEREGLVPTKQWKRARFGEAWQKGETLSLSIGQGFMLVTPLQLLRIYCAIANGGTLYKPQLVRQVESPGGEVIAEVPPEMEAHIPVDMYSLRLLRQALWGVVNDDRGTGKALRRPERDVCGKTGTAQVIGIPEGDDAREQHVIYRLRDHALFVCFAPRDNPEVAVVVVVEHGGHGGSVAAPIARKIIDGYFEYRANGNTVPAATEEHAVPETGTEETSPIEVSEETD